MTISRNLRLLLALLAVLPFGPRALADAKVEVYNLTIGTNKFLTTVERIGRCEVVGSQFVRVKCEEGGNSIEVFPVTNGKTRVLVYEATQGRLSEDIRVNVCTKDIIAMYDQYKGLYGSVEGLVIDIDGNRVSFSGIIFSLSSFKEINDVAAAKGFNASGLKLHPYVNAVLQAPSSSLGPPPTPGADGAKLPSP